jgi:hypothetical protein
MMNGDKSYRRRALAGVLVAALVAAVVGVAAYDAGVSHGLAQQVAAAGNAPAAYPYPYHWHRPWGFGIFFPLLFGFLLLRLIFWGGFGHRRWGGGAYCGTAGRDVPPAFEEWHRRAHERPRDPAATGV